MKATARRITARATDTSDSTSTTWTREMFGTRFYFERYEPFTTETGDNVAGYVSAWRFNTITDSYELAHSWNIPMVRIADPEFLDASVPAECDDCGAPVTTLAWVSEEHKATCPHHDPHF